MATAPSANNPNYFIRAGTVMLNYAPGSVNGTSGFNYFVRAGTVMYPAGFVFWVYGGEHSRIITQAVNRASTY